MVYYIHIKLLLAKHFNFYEGKDNKTKCAKTTLGLVSMNIIGEDISTPFSPFAYEPAFLSLAVSMCIKAPYVRPSDFMKHTSHSIKL